MSESTPPPAATTSSQPTPALRKKRLWLKILLGLFIVVILLIALAPTIISTGAVKSIVLGQVNKNLNGRVEIASWSIGWTSGVRADGIRVFDESNAQIAEVKSASTELSLIGAARGNLALGNTILDTPKFDAKIDKNGKSNFEKLVKHSPEAPKSAEPRAPASPKEPAEATKVPNLSGDFKLVNGSGTVMQEGQPDALFITAIDGEVKITDINQPIENSLEVAMKVGYSGKPGKIAVKGKASAVHNNVVDLNTANVDETVTLTSIDVPAAAPFIPASVGVSPKSGTIDSQLALAVKDGKLLTLSGQINGQNISADGAALKGDTFAIKAFQVAIPATTVTMPNGPTDVNAMVAKTGPNGEPIAVTFDQGSASVAIDAPLVGLMNLAANKAPGTTGKLDVDAKVDVGKLAAMLPHTFRVREGTTVTSGSFHQTVNFAMTNEAATFKLTTDLTNVAGRNDATDVHIQPINVTLTGQVGPSSTSIPGLKDVNLNLTSGFATANFAAPTLSQLKGQAKVELAKAQSELGQIVDFGVMKMAGNLNVDIDTKSDPNDATKLADLGVVATLTDLRIDGLADHPVTEPWLKSTINASIFGKTDGSIQSVKNIQLMLQSGQQSSPTIDLAAVSNIDLENGTSITYQLTKLNVVLSSLQRELGPLVPALRDVKPLDLGTLAITSEGSLTQTKDLMTARLTSLSVIESKGLISITQTSPLTVKIAGSLIQPAGKVQIAADLVRLSDILQQLSNGKATVQVNGQSQKLNSGKLAGTVELATLDASNISVAVDMAASDISLDSKSGPSEKQTISFGLKTTPAADFTSIKNTSVYAKASFMDVSVTDVAVDLPKAALNAVGPALPIVRSAKLAINVNDVGPLQSLLDAFAPPANDPANPAMSVTSGQLKVLGNVTHEGTATVLTLSEVSGTDLVVHKGQASKKLKPFNVNLVAKIDISGDTSQTLAQQFKEVTIAIPTGHLGLAELSTPDTIKITNPLGTMAAAGAVSIDGEAKDATTLLEALAGKQPGELYPFSGHYSARMNLSTSGNTVTLKGPIDVADFKVLDKAGQPLVAEPKIAVAVDVNADTVAHNAKINALNIDMPSSGALVLHISGGVTDWETKRQIDSMKVLFAGDWDKLWPIIKPLIPPDQQTQIADLKLSGKFERNFNVSGSYPAGMEMAQAIKLLTADGSVTIANADWPSMGITASNLEVPIYLKDGIVRFVYAGKPEGQNAPSPMTVNTGTVNISGLSVDLTEADPRLNAPKDYLFAQNIAINNVLAARCGKYIPLFSNASSASGLLSATLVECNRLPLSQLATQNVKANDGTAKVVWSVQQVQIGSPVVNALLEVLSKSEAGSSLRGDIKDATISVANGKVTQDTTLSLGENAGRAIRFAGGVDMTSLKLNDFIVNLPTSLLKQFSKDLAKYLPAGVDVGLKGLVTSPQLDLGNSVNKMFGDAAKKALMGNLLGGDKNDKGGDKTQPSDQKAVDPIGGLLDQLGKKKDKKKKKDN